MGLGNPGPEYADTRHNAGFRFLEAISARYRCDLRKESRFAGLAGKTIVDGSEVWLLEPQTFMNLSGDSVSKLARYYKIPPEAILVAHDELDLPVGAVRLKQGGGAGGHNGLSDITEKLGSAAFMRLRLGIGRPSGGGEKVVAYVLGRAPAVEQQLIDAAIDRTQQYVPDLVAGRFQQVMNKLHSAASGAA